MAGLLKKKETGVVAIIMLLCIPISLTSSSFLTLENLLNLAKSNIVLCILAMGMLPVMLTGGIDVSIAQIVALVSVCVGKMMSHASDDFSVFLIFLIAIIIGSVLGAVNGLVVSKGFPPIAVTLGTSSIMKGIINIWTNGMWINTMPNSFIEFGSIKLFPFTTESGVASGVSVQFLFLVAVIVLTAFFLKYTMVGRSIYAYGGNKISASRTGFNLNKTLMVVYTYAGLMAGVAAMIHVSIMRQIDPVTFNGFELNVVAVVVLGGVSVIGGSGSVIGTIFGVILMSVVSNGLVLAHISTYWQQVITGGILILTVIYDAVSTRMKNEKVSRVDVEPLETDIISEGM